MRLNNRPRDARRRSGRGHATTELQKLGPEVQCADGGRQRAFRWRPGHAFDEYGALRVADDDLVLVPDAASASRSQDAVRRLAAVQKHRMNLAGPGVVVTFEGNRRAVHLAAERKRTGSIR